MSRGWYLLPLAAALAACGSGPAGPAAPSRARVDPSEFFAGDLPEYAKGLDGISRSRLLVLRAIRKVDPCALVPKEDLSGAQPPLVDAVGGDALDSCRLSFADDGPGERLDVGVTPDADRSPGEEYFQVRGQTVYQGRSTDLATYSFFFDSGLAKYPGAPRDVPDAKIEVRAYRHDNPCGLANSVATAIVNAKPANLPVRSQPDKVFGADPCATAADGQRAMVDFADTGAYRCGLVAGPDEHSLWVEFHRLPGAEVAKFPESEEDGAPVWSDPAAGPGPAKGASSSRRTAKSSAAPSKSPTGQRCTAYVNASVISAAPAADPDPAAQSATTDIYVAVGGQIDCSEAKRLAVAAAKHAAR